MGARRLRYGAVFLLVLSAVLVLLWWARPEMGKAASLARSPRRKLEARLTRFRYQPPPPARPERLTRSGSSSGATEHSSHPESLRAVALSQLLYGDVDKAVRGLEKAAGLSPKDATLRSNLSAAYLVRAEEKQRPDELIRALSAALEATRLDPGLPEAEFNRALISEKLFLRQQAIEAWRTYLDLDQDSDWRQKANRHLQTLKQPTLIEIWPAERDRLYRTAEAGEVTAVREIVRRFPQASREYVEEKLFGDWAEAQGKDDLATASRVLKAAEVIGGVVFEVTGDAMARDSTAVIQRTVDAVNPLQLERLVKGHRAFREGKKLYDDLEVRAAAEPLARSRDSLKLVGSPFQSWAGFYHAFCVYRQGDLETALARFNEIRSDAGQYPILRGHSDWMVGQIRNHQGRFGPSLTHYDRALAAFVQTRQLQNAASVHFLIAEDLTFLGDFKQAEAHLYQALRSTHQIFKRRWAVTILEKAAETARLTGHPLVSLQLLNEAVDTAIQDGKPAVLSEAILSRALAHYELASPDKALKDLDAATGWINKVSDHYTQRVIEAQLLAAQGKILRKSQPDRVIGDLSKAIEDRSQSGVEVATAALYLERGRAYLEIGQYDQAEDDFLAGIQAYEKSRPTAPEEQLRISYFDQAREVFDDMIAFQADVRHEPMRALLFSENARARELFDAVARGTPYTFETPDLDALRKNLPPDVAVLYYATLKDEVLSWSITGDHIGFFRQALKTTDLQNQVDALLQAAGSDAQGRDFQEPASSLYDILIRPLREELSNSSTLIVIPDKFLHKVPFAALFNRRSRRYLVEDHAIAASPSLAILRRSSGPLLGGKLKSRALVIGNPAFDRTRFPDLPSLPGAEAEAEKISKIFPHAGTLVGKMATEKAFLDAAGLYEIVHFGGHSISNEEFPFASQLLLAPDSAADDDGSLSAHEICRHRFPKTRLVVLAACSTARARISSGEGALSIARPFLADGVPAVLASLWEIDDSSSTELLYIFYTHLAGGFPPVEALHQAQMILLQRASGAEGNHSNTWAAFEIIQGTQP